MKNCNKNVENGIPTKAGKLKRNVFAKLWLDQAAALFSIIPATHPHPQPTRKS